MKRISLNNDVTLLKLYTVRELAQFGIGERELYRWTHLGWLTPFTYSGKHAKYRYQDFMDACQKNMQVIQSQ